MTDLLIMRHAILLDQSPVVYDRPFSAASLAEDWEVKNADWRFEDGAGDGRGAFLGRNPLAAPGCLLSRRPFPGDVLLDFYAQTVAPSTRDINVMWRTSWNEATNTRGASYVTGLNGWWDGKIGIERSPEYALIAGTPCPWFEPGRPYHIQAGGIGGHCFIFVDGVLRLEMFDPDPIDPAVNNRIGFEAYQSIIRVWGLTVRELKWADRTMSYPAEF